MRKLEKMIRKVRYRSDAGKVLLAALVAIWMAAAASPTRVSNDDSFDGFGNSTSRLGCGGAPVAGCGLLLNPATLARYIEIVPPGAAKPPHRPARFAFRNMSHGSRGTI